MSEHIHLGAERLSRHALPSAEPDSPEELAHLASCQACRDELAAYRRLNLDLAALPGPKASAQLTAHALARITQQRAAQARNQRLLLSGSLGALACLGLALTVLAWPRLLAATVTVVTLVPAATKVLAAVMTAGPLPLPILVATCGATMLLAAATLTSLARAQI